MGFELPLFSALSDKMRWHEARQKLLAENVANAETPNYRGRDLKVFNFAEHLADQPFRNVGTTITNTMHIAATSSSGGAAFRARQANSFEITPEGNEVSLEDEMMKVTSNEMDFQAVTSLYTRSMKVLRTALGR